MFLVTFDGNQYFVTAQKLNTSLERDKTSDWESIERIPLNVQGPTAHKKLTQTLHDPEAPKSHVRYLEAILEVTARDLSPPTCKNMIPLK